MTRRGRERPSLHVVLHRHNGERTKAVPPRNKVQLSLLDPQEPADRSGNPDPDTYTGLYAVHKYWSRKPGNVVRSIIERHTSPGDVVLDPFAGSGVTLIEAVLSGRRAVGVDLNPIAVFLTQTSIADVDLRELEAAFRDLKTALADRVAELYRTRCPQCGGSGIATHLVWNADTVEQIWCACQQCGAKKAIKNPDAEDLQRANPSIEAVDGLWVPNAPLIPNSRINAKAGMTVRDLFDGRNLMMLAYIREAIMRKPPGPVRDHLLLAFTAAVPQASKMVFVVRRRGKNTGNDQPTPPQVGSWVIGYWCPADHFEVNAWNCFERRFSRLLKGKRELQVRRGTRRFVGGVEAEVFQKRADYALKVSSATSLDGIPDESVDYIFTDPPHRDRVPYLELSMLWNSWLGIEASLEEEIIVSNASSRSKDDNDYFRRLGASFAEMARVLRPGSSLSLAYNTLDEDTWYILVEMIEQQGLHFAEATTIGYSAASVVQDNRQKGLNCDLLLTWRKPSAVTAQGGPKLQRAAIADDIRAELVEHLRAKRNGMRVSELLSEALIYGLENGMVYGISDILSLIESEFTAAGLVWTVDENKPSEG